MRKLVFVFLLGWVLCLSACNRPDVHESDVRKAQLDIMQEKIEHYLADTYPDKTFKVELWETYEMIYRSVIPDHYGYILHQVVTDAEGNRFKVFFKYNDDLQIQTSTTEYSDDYAEVLAKEVYYDTKGNRVFPL